MATFLEKFNQEYQGTGIDPRTRESFEWLNDKVENLNSINRSELLNEPTFRKVKRPIIGRMYMYRYDPKHKETLPYYDRFPLVFIVGPAKGGWLGLNMHYLPPILRAKFFDKLLSYTTNNQYNRATRLKLTYELLKSISRLRMYRLCLKHYLTKQLKTMFVEVHPRDWELVLYLPTDRFLKQKRTAVWTEIRKEYRNLF